MIKFGTGPVLLLADICDKIEAVKLLSKFSHAGSLLQINHLPLNQLTIGCTLKLGRLWCFS